MQNSVIKIYQDKYPIPPVMKALKENDFKWNTKESCFIGKRTKDNEFFLKLLKYI